MRRARRLHTKNAVNGKHLQSPSSLSVLRAAHESVFGPSRHFAVLLNLVASLIGRFGSSAFRLSTSAVSMSLAGSCFSSDSAPGPLYGAFFVKKFKDGGASFFFH